jgi:hypothetical protein
MESQLAEFIWKKGGVNLSTTTIFRAPAPLSLQIYKIYTLLATVFVENVPQRALAARRKALPGADFGGLAAPSHAAGDRDASWLECPHPDIVHE